MNKQEFLNVLETKLNAKVNREETASLVQYYDGYIDEALDFGMSEEEIIQQLGDLNVLVEEITRGLSDENIDISTRELAVATTQLAGLEMDLRNTKVEVIYDDSVQNISVKVDKRYKQDYLVKTIDGIFKIKQIKSTISLGPGFSFRYNMGEGDNRKSLFDFDFDLQITSRKLYVTIPKQFDLKTRIETSNAKIEVRGEGDVVQTQPYILITSNSEISLRDMKVQNLKMKTNNASIKVSDVDSETMELITTNGKVVIEYVLAKNLNIQTSNAKVDMMDVLFLNGDIKTSNGKIVASLKNNDLKKHIRFKTSNGRVTIDETRYDTTGEVDFDNVGEQMNLELRTTNARIELENFM